MCMHIYIYICIYIYIYITTYIIEHIRGSACAPREDATKTHTRRNWGTIQVCTLSWGGWPSQILALRIHTTRNFGGRHQAQTVSFRGRHVSPDRRLVQTRLARAKQTVQQQLFTLLDLCVSSLRRGHANLLCIVPILTDDPRRESENKRCNKTTIRWYADSQRRRAWRLLSYSGSRKSRSRPWEDFDKEATDTSVWRPRCLRRIRALECDLHRHTASPNRLRVGTCRALTQSDS